MHPCPDLTALQILGDLKSASLAYRWEVTSGIKIFVCLLIIVNGVDVRNEKKVPGHV